MEIQVEIKNVYGTQNIYPVCGNAKIFADLVKQKTLTLRDIDLIKKLGYEVKVIQPTVKL